MPTCVLTCPCCVTICLHAPSPLPPPCCRKRPKASSSEWDSVEATPAAANLWDATPGGALGGATPGPNSWDATPGAGLGAGGSSRWDATPGAGLGTGATPAPRRNRWDETPAAVSDKPAAEKSTVWSGRGECACACDRWKHCYSCCITPCDTRRGQRPGLQAVSLKQAHPQGGMATHSCH